MSSSISSSDPQADAGWGRWLAFFVAVLIGGLAALYALVVLVDPYSTGRFTPIKRIDFVTGNRLYDSTPRIRDLRFESAIFGNSHAIPISPAALDQATNLRFVMLGIEGTWPQEHLYLMRAFNRYRRSPTFIVVIDDTWCSPTVKNGYVVPRWLLDNTDLTYLRRILSPFSLRTAWRRLLILSGFAVGHSPNGYDAAPEVPPGNARMRRDMETMSRPVDAADADAPFPYLDDLRQTLAEINPQGTVLMVFTPVYAKHMPVPGSRADVRMSACKGKVDAIARARPRTSMLDLRVESPKFADIDNFIDRTHYKDTIARDIEAAIVQRLNAMIADAGR